MSTEYTGLEIAVIGLALRFPGADSPEELWELLREGRSGVRELTDEELLASGISKSTFQKPNYVKAAGVVDGEDLFDAGLFGFSPREAELLDPQHRLFLECAWTALEHAGYRPRGGNVGVYAGAYFSGYHEINVASRPDILATTDISQRRISYGREFLTTRVAHRLDLEGPAVAVQTACSTSLVAVHMACQGLLGGSCDLALAGGVTIREPQRSGYLHHPGDVRSPDGRCCAFDADSHGTVASNGVGLAVLKRLDEAIDDGDTIYAVIKGSAINNDGSRKASFTAPSVEGQVRAIRAAHLMAEVDPRSITFIEAHGTGTAVGDPIEVAALTRAFRAGTDDRGFCALGSVKTNLGHLDTAAGIAGFAKAVLSVYHRQVPATLHFRAPNPELHLESSPFFVNHQLIPWPASEGPRRAGVSSFGFGGTNAHVVLEEPPRLESEPAAAEVCRLLLLSARSREVLDRATADLAEFLEAHSELAMDDVAHTLHVGRVHQRHRRVLVGRGDAGETAAELRELDPKKVATRGVEETGRPLVFLFPGQGAQHPGMGEELYRHEPRFRAEVDRCAEILEPHLGFDLRRLLYPEEAEREQAAAELTRTSRAQPALFTIEYALARWLEQSWGLEPEAMVGHSIGEYVAACLAGVFSLDDALALVAARGRLMDSLPGGSMLSVPLPEAEIEPYLGDGVELAAINGPSLLTVSGPDEAIEGVAQKLAEAGVEARPLHTSHAFHSARMEPILDAFRAEVEKVERHAPRRPYLSNLTGTWVTAEAARSPDAWAEHLRRAVRFADGVRELLEDPSRAYVEVGPGRALTTFLRQAGGRDLAAQPLLGSPKDRGHDLDHALGGIGRLWLAGVDLDDTRYRQDDRPARRRVALPTYPFDHRRFWIEPGEGGIQGSLDLSKKDDPTDWLYAASWRRAPLLEAPATAEDSEAWLVLSADDLGQRLAERLRQRGQMVAVVEAGPAFRAHGERRFTVAPTAAGDYERLLDELRAEDFVPRRVVHAWSVPTVDDETYEDAPYETFLAAQDHGFLGLFFLARALGHRPPGEGPADLLVLSSQLQQVLGDEEVSPAKAPLPGLCRVVGQEYPHLTCRHIDLPTDVPVSGKEIDSLLAEVRSRPFVPMLAYRAGHRWIQEFEPLAATPSADPIRVRDGGVYLVLGGLGRMGSLLGEALARAGKGIRLVLTTRTVPPPRELWDEVLADPATGESTRRKIEIVRHLESLGAEVMPLAADVTDPAAMEKGLEAVRQRFGGIHGTLFATGQMGKQAAIAIGTGTREQCEAHWRPKALGLPLAERLLRPFELDFLMVVSSLSTILGGVTYGAYAAANYFQDVYVQRLARRRGDGSTRYLCVDFDAWVYEETEGNTLELIDLAIRPAEGVELMGHILAMGPPTQLLVSTTDLKPRADKFLQPAAPESADSTAAGGDHERPDLGVDFVAPRDETEATIAGVWSTILGIADIGVHDDFFELGGHSLSGIQLTVQLGRAFGIELSSGVFFEHPTIAELAEAVRDAKPADPEEEEALPTLVPAPDEQHLPFPLTDVQQAYWVGRSQSFDLGNIGTHGYFELDCPELDIPRFESTLRALIQRHGMMRAIFHEDATQQILEEVPPYEVHVLDLSSLSAEEAEARLLGVREEMSHQLFDASRWPLFDIRASRLPRGEGPEIVRLHFSLDVLILDGWSGLKLFGDLVTLYRDPGASLPPIELSFRDYVLAEKELESSTAYRKALEYWRGRLATFPEAPDLPLACNPASLEKPRFTRRRAVLEPAAWQRLQQRAGAAGLTPTAVLLAAFSRALAGWSKSPRFSLNLTLFNRLPLHPQIDRLLGDFTSLVLLEVDLEPRESFTERSRRIQKQLWADLDHRLVSGVRVLRELARQRGGQVSMPVVFTSTLALGGPREESMPALTELGDVAYNITQTPQVWLDHQLAESPDGGMAYRWDAVEDLFPEGLLDAMFATYSAMVEHLAAEDEAAWDDPSVCPLPADQAERRRSYNDTAMRFTGGDAGADLAAATLDSLFAACAERQPEAPAIFAPGREISYGELRDRSRALARRLHESGVEPGDVVAVVMEKGWEQAVAVLATSYLGAVYLPIDAGFPGGRIHQLLELGGVSVALTQPWLRDHLEWPDGIASLPVDADPPDPATIETDFGRRPTSDDIAYVIYTSGSTGRPKGVVIDHRGAVNTLLDINRRFDVGPRDRVLALSSLTFDLSVYDIFGTLAAGAAIVFPEAAGTRDPAHWSELLAEHRVSLWNSVPALMQLLVEYSEGQKDRGDEATGTSLRTVMLSGDWIPVDLPDRIREQFPGSRVTSLGGATEGSIWSILYPIEEVPEHWTSIPYGHPMANQSIHVLDANLEPRPEWVPGDLYIGGIGVAKGYWRDPERTAASFVEHPEWGEILYRTGDLGRFLPSGEVEFLGREDSQVKIQGYRVELGEIESALGRHPRVASAVVAARGPSGGRRLAAYYTLDGGTAGLDAAGATTLEEELRDLARRHLPPYMVPATFTALETIPLSANGKVDRKALPEPAAYAPAPATAPGALPEHERILRRLADFVDISQVEPETDLLALGLTSVDAIRLINQLERDLGVRPDVAAFYAAPNLAGLSELCGEALGTADGSPGEEQRAFLAATEASDASARAAIPPLRPAPRGTELPLSFAQQRLWFLDRLEPESPFYNLTRAFTVEGDLQLPVLRRALGEIHRRHETLRTGYGEQEGQPRLLIHSDVEPDLRFFDLLAQNPEDPLAALRELCSAEADAPFDLARPPLLRALLVRTRPDRQVLILTVHHIISDAWSLDLLAREIAAFYQSLTSGEPVALPEIEVQYADYAAWQRGWLEGEILEGQLAYWRERLDGLPPLELPTDRPRPARQTYRGAELRVTLPDDLTAALRNYAAERGVSLFMVLLAGVQSLLSRLGGQSDLALGTSIANRSRRELEPLLGFFINSLVLRGQVDEDASFDQQVARARELSVEAYAHQDVPFERLVDELQPERDLSRNPLFQAMFHFFHHPAREVSSGEVTWTPLELDAGQRSLFDFTLFLWDTGEEIRGGWEYNTDLFDATTIRRWSRQLEHLLRAALAAPERPLRRIPHLDPAQRHQLLAEWNDTRVASAALPLDPALGDLASLFRARAEARPDATALLFDDTGDSLDYGELARRSERLAAHLQADLGIGPESLVGVCLERSHELLIALLAVLEAGGAYVPLDPSYPAQRLAFMIEDAGLAAVITTEELGTRAELADLPRVLMDRPIPEAPFRRPAVHPDSLAYTLFTSGSTGRPKGAMNSHRAIVNRLRWMQQAFPLDPSDRVLQKTPFSFDVSVWELFWPLITGATMVIARPEAHKDSAAMVRLVRATGVTTLHFVPSMLQAFVDEAEVSTCASLRRVIASGEALPHDLARRFHQRLDAELHNLYGPTEAAVDVTHAPCRPGDERVTLGRPIANLEIHLLDRQDRPVPVGVAGELHIGGIGLGRGYLQRPALTAERFVPHPTANEPGARLYRTGDLARRRTDGTVEYLGRLDHQVKVRGFRIELGEIEAALAQHSAVREAVVVVRTEAAGQQRLVGYVTSADPSRPAPAEELRADLLEHLPEHMVPPVLVALEALPQLPNGKIDRKALPAPTESGTPTPGAAPRGRAEETLAEIWRQVLQLDTVAADDNFFTLGGDSILSIQVVSRANREGFRLTPQLLFRHPTLAALAAAGGPEATGAATETAADPTTATPESDGAEIPLTPIQHWFFEASPTDEQHWNQAVLLEVRKPLDEARRTRALRRLVANHEAFRLRFEPRDDGWHQQLGPAFELEVESIDLSRLPANAARAALEAHADEVQAGLDLASGPLFRAVYFELAGAARLLLVAHHLIVDGVTWRVLLEDLESLWSAAAAGAEAVLLPATTPFTGWARRLRQHTEEGGFDAELGFWARQLAPRAGEVAMPCDGEGGANTVATSEVVEVSLGSDRTAALLRSAPGGEHGPRIDELLLSACFGALTDWTGGSALRLDLEGHGRQIESLPDVDLGRTVGWLTAVYPVVLERPAEAGPGVAPADAAAPLARAVGERLRAIPGGGQGFGALRYLAGDPFAGQLAALPASQIAFNYLGRLDLMLSQESAFAPARERYGTLRSAAGERRYRLEIDARVLGGELQVAFTFSRGFHHRETIEALARSFLGWLEPWAGPPSGGEPTVRSTSARVAEALPAEALATAEPVGHALSPVQQGMLLHALREPEEGLYFQQMVLALEGPLDPERLRRALERLSERHPPLRSSFRWRGLDEPLQKVETTVELPWAEEDLRSHGDPDSTLDQRLQEDRGRGLELDRAPVQRFTLFRTAERSWRLLWSYHHLLFDGWSLPLLLRDLMALYRGDAPLAEAPPRPFAEYPRWLAERREREAREEAELWSRELRGFLAPTPLPGDGYPDADMVAEGPARGEEFGEERITLDPEQSAGLLAAARALGVTFSTLLQGAWSLVLASSSGETDVVFGTTVSGRGGDLDGIESMVGMFINTLPARVRCSPDARVRSWLAGLQQQHADRIRFEHSPLVEIHGHGEMPRERPLFESILVVENYPLRQMDRSLDAELVLAGLGTVERTHYPLTVVAMPAAALTLAMGFDRRRFGRSAVRRLLRELARTLAVLATSPERRLGELPRLGAEEIHQLHREWNDTRLPFAPPAPTLHGIFRATAEHFPDRVALVLDPGTGSNADGETRVLTYGELDRRAARLSTELRRRGVGPETVVALAVERSFERLVAMLGVLGAGAAYLPLDPSMPGERLAWILEDAGAAMLLTREEDRSLLAADALPEGLPVALLASDGSLSGSLPAPVAEPGAPSEDPDHLAYVIYTSGSTGRPKGVPITHRGIVNTLLWRLHTFALEPDDAILQNITYTFDPSLWQIFGALLSGGRLVLVSPGDEQDFAHLARRIAEERVTITDFAPSMLDVFLEQGQARDCTSLRLLFAGGEALPPALADRFLHTFDADLRNIYGPTEASVDAACWRCEAGAEGTVPIGGPIANKELWVLDPELHPVRIGQPGELVIGGEGLARGYLRDPRRTAERFVPHAFAEAPGARLYRTGDRVRRRGDGAIEFLGRFDRQVKVRGFRIELGEVESALARHPDLREAAVTTLAGATGEKQLAAFYAAQPGAELAPEALRRHLEDRLPGYMVPSRLEPLAELPRTVNGKVDFKALPAAGSRQSPEASTTRAPGIAAPRTPLQRSIAEIWCELLGRDSVGLDDNFFDLGGHSLLLMRVHARLPGRLAEEGIELSVGHPDEIPMVELFNHPTVRSFARHLDPAPAATPAVLPAPDAGDPADDGVAILSMVGRFPGSADVDELWQHLLAGEEGIHFFSDEELRRAGIAEATFRDPEYVRASGTLADVELFDAGFFGISPREAEAMDPQQRLFLECAWQALEEAAIDPRRYSGAIGVYGGVGANTYLLHNLLANPGFLASVNRDQAALGSDKDYLTTRASYKLDLRGPSLTVQTACSTSLVAVHLAMQAILSGQCDTALAGGSSITVPQVRGYQHQSGGIHSPDGHCRAFDADAAGTVRGSGVGVVVLKRLSRALADGDPIRAVVRGTAINNDGSAKVGYTAPSADGQAEVIAAAQRQAGVTPAEIGYVEAHGTGTPLGDPIEISALNRVFSGAEPESCAVGSIKSNLGHLDTAAGVAGLIKAALVVESGEIPPSLHFREPNPHIDFGAFYVNAERRPWTGPLPRRAGVSSFGIGGTNAHAVVEQAPKREPSGPSREVQLLTLSARSPEALEAARQRLAAHLEKHPEQPLADVAYTSMTGRRAFSHRLAVAASSHEEAREALVADRPGREAATDPPPVAFLFPGQGAQHPGMAEGLYRTEAVFRAQVDRAAEILRPRLGLDLRDLLFPAPDADAEEAARALSRTAVAQPALFTVEYALARLLAHWGLAPAACLGHSVGEYVAACLAGVFTFEDALALIATRGQLMQELPEGSMLAVSLPAEELEGLLGEELSVAASNGPSRAVVSGPDEAIDRLCGTLQEREISHRRLLTSHAFHSGMMDPILDRFTRAVAAVERRAPRTPFVSNLTGTWITAAQATDPEYWAQHLRRAVRFADGVSTLLDESSDLLLVEVGPGNTLGTLARRIAAGRNVLPTLPHPKAQTADLRVLLASLGQLWMAGCDLDLDGFWQGESRRRVRLPTYPFERQRYWVEPDPDAAMASAPKALSVGRSEDPADWLYTPVWHEIPAPAETATEPDRWLVLADRGGFGDELAASLRQKGHQVVSARAGESYSGNLQQGFELSPGRREDFAMLFRELEAAGTLPRRIAFLWSLDDLSQETYESAVGRCFHALLWLGRACADHHEDPETPVALTLVTRELQEITGEESPDLLSALVQGPARALPLELPSLRCRVVDLKGTDSPKLRTRALDQLRAELHESPAAAEPAVAWRGRRRFAPAFQRRAETATRAPDLRADGIYLVTGGLGGVGLELARSLAEQGATRLVLVGRRALPPRAAWDRNADPDVASRIDAVRELEALGAEVWPAAADVADRDAMADLLAEVKERWGPVHGVIHAAGTPGSGPIETFDSEQAAHVLAPKVLGTRVLSELLAERELDFFVLCSSLASILGGVGQVDYAAANAYLDACAQHRGERPVLTINWDTWKETGMAHRHALERGRPEDLEQGLSNRQGTRIFRQILAAHEIPQTVVSTLDFEALRQRFRPGAEEEAAEAAERAAPHRRTLDREVTPPRNQTETVLCEIFEEVLGIEPIGIDDDFNELGGDSLLAIQVLSRIRRSLGAELELRALFEHPTAARLAIAVLDQQAVHAAPDHLDEMLAELDDLSEEEVEALLQEDLMPEGAP